MLSVIKRFETEKRARTSLDPTGLVELRLLPRRLEFVGFGGDFAAAAIVFEAALCC